MQECFDPYFPIHDGSTVCIFEWPDEFSVVSVGCTGQLLCCTCSRNVKGCKHVTNLLSLKDSGREYPSSLQIFFSYVDTPVTTSVVQVSPCVVSRQKIPISLSETQATILERSGVHTPNKDGVVTLSSVKGLTECSLCSSRWKRAAKRMPLVTETTTVYVEGKLLVPIKNAIIPLFECHTVETAVCENCGQKVPYDGFEDAVLNLSTCLVSYDILRSYLHTFLNGRYTMFIHFRVMYLPKVCCI